MTFSPTQMFLWLYIILFQHLFFLEHGIFLLSEIAVAAIFF